MTDWGYFVIFSCLPKYMYDVINFDVHDTGVYSSLPWMMRTVASYIFSFSADFLIARKRISVTNARKLSLFLGEMNTIL